MALPTIEFAAPEIRAAIAQLEANIAGQVAVFNAEGNVQLDTPETFHFGGQDLLNAYAFPQIEVAAATGKIGPFAIQRVEANYDIKLNVAVWLQGEIGDVPTLYEQTLGTVRCVIECLTPPNACGPGVEIAQRDGIVWRADVVPHDPTARTPAEGRDFQKWLGSGLIQFALENVVHFT